MKHYNITYTLQGYNHSLCILALDEHLAKMKLRDFLINQNIEVWLCNIIKLELSNA